MRKLLFPLLAIAVLAAAGAAARNARPATAATATVKITKTGYSPASVSIVVGDSVSFSNTDTVAHTVDFKSTTGMHCDVAIPLAIQPTQSASCSFASTGKFTFSDPSNKGRNFRGSITVGKPPAASIAAAPKTVVFGRKVTLSGMLASKQAGVSLQLLAQQCGASASTALANVTTTTGGAFTYNAALPLMQTAYTVKVRNSTSRPATVKVKPRLRLSRVGHRRYLMRAFAAETFAGKYATFQRYSSTRKRWVTVKHVLLRANTTGVAPTVITSAKFRSRVKGRQRVRLLLGQAQVGTCYVAGRSNTIRSYR